MGSMCVGGAGVTHYTRNLGHASINAVPCRDGRGVSFLLVNLASEEQARIKLTHEAIAAMYEISRDIQRKRTDA